MSRLTLSRIERLETVTKQMQVMPIFFTSPNEVHGYTITDDLLIFRDNEESIKDFEARATKWAEGLGRKGLVYFWPTDKHGNEYAV